MLPINNQWPRQQSIVDHRSEKNRELQLFHETLKNHKKSTITKTITEKILIGKLSMRYFQPFQILTKKIHQRVRKNSEGSTFIKIKIKTIEAQRMPLLALIPMSSFSAENKRGYILVEAWKMMSSMLQVRIKSVE